MSKEIEEDISIIKNIIYSNNERVSYIDIDDFCDDECKTFIQAIESILKDNETNKKRIEELEEENKKKDKIIDLMAEKIASDNRSINEEYAVDEKMMDTKYIKQYFEKKVSDGE